MVLHDPEVIPPKAHVINIHCEEADGVAISEDVDAEVSMNLNVANLL